MVANLAADPDDKDVSLEIDLNSLGESDGGFEADGDSLVVIRVAENPTTGFRWSVDSSDCGARLREVSSDFEAPTNGLIGAGGVRVWTYETPAPEENYIRGLPCDLGFYNARPWMDNSDATPDVTVSITIN